ncbi:MAG: porin PorA family protein [Acidimicrobiales bacterium]
MLAAGLTLLVVAALWRPLAVPRLATFPSSVDETTHYGGTFTLYVEPATGQPLAEPMSLPLVIHRRVHTLPGGGAHTVVVEEAVSYQIADTTQEERHQYVIDRRSMQHRDDGRSWSFSPENRIHQAGTYRVTLPLGTTADDRYRIWENEPGTSFWMVRDPDRARVRQNGLALIGFQEVWQGAPVATHYLDELRKQGFAVELTFPQLATRLAAEGVDVERALGALPPADASVVAAARETALPLRFVRDNDGHALVEPRTGTIVDLVYSDEAIRAAVDLAPLRRLRDALVRSAHVPEIAALAGALDAIDRAVPTPVYSLRYEQTPASVAAAAGRTRNDIRKLDLVERYVPGGLAALSVVLLVVVAIGRWPRRRTEQPVEATPPAHERVSGRPRRNPGPAQPRPARATRSTVRRATGSAPGGCAGHAPGLPTTRPSWDR